MSPDNTGPEDKPEGLSKYLKRMKTALRPRAAKRQSIATMLDDPAQASSAEYALLSLAT